MKDPIHTLAIFNNMLKFYRHGEMGAKLLTPGAVHMLAEITSSAMNNSKGYVVVSDFLTMGTETTIKRCLRFLKEVGFLTVVQSKRPQVGTAIIAETRIVYRYNKESGRDVSVIADCFKTLLSLITTMHKQTLYPVLLHLLRHKRVRGLSVATYQGLQQLIASKYTGLELGSVQCVRRLVLKQGNQHLFSDYTVAKLKPKQKLELALVELSEEGMVVAEAMVRLYLVIEQSKSNSSIRFEQTSFKFAR